MALAAVVPRSPAIRPMLVTIVAVPPKLNQLGFSMSLLNGHCSDSLSLHTHAMRTERSVKGVVLPVNATPDGGLPRRGEHLTLPHRRRGHSFHNPSAAQRVRFLERTRC